MRLVRAQQPHAARARRTAVGSCVLPEPPTLDPAVAAEVAQLHYVNDRLLPGITRRAADGGGFVYLDPAGRQIDDPGELQRIRSLAIPPAWSDVWICPDRDGHLQAIGYDAKGRKQYRYHPRWRLVRDETKFEHMLGFGQSLPRIRRRVKRDLDRSGLPREKVVAAVVRLMERSLARVGNEEYARENEHFGLTTLRDEHVRVENGVIELDFRGKHGVHHHVQVSDRKLASILENCRELPGSEVFKYLDESGAWHRISSEHVNAYLHETAGGPVTAKDFRTWAATNLALIEEAKLHERKPTKRSAATVVRRVAAQLGNTPAVCRKSYIHPRVLSCYLDGSLSPTLAEIASGERLAGMWAVEGMTMRLLAQWAGVPESCAPT
ncbi:MAG: topoisomerase [Rhodospirillales bacterium]|nr:topoisomerase [Rhodospirillales bacterium]